MLLSQFGQFLPRPIKRPKLFHLQPSPRINLPELSQITISNSERAAEKVTFCKWNISRWSESDLVTTSEIMRRKSQFWLVATEVKKGWNHFLWKGGPPGEIENWLVQMSRPSDSGIKVIGKVVGREWTLSTCLVCPSVLLSTSWLKVRQRRI